MSKETLEHLNTNTLIGNTDARGHAWRYRAEEQGTETNHYPGPIPVADVQRRLYFWVVESRRIAVEDRPLRATAGLPSARRVWCVHWVTTVPALSVNCY